MYKEESRIDRISIIAKASAIGLALLVASCQSIPDGETGSPADALASKMLAAANLETWNTRVQGVEFRFREKNTYFWDKKRGLVEFQNEDLKVQFSKNTFQGVAWEDGEALSGDELAEAVVKANSNFINDSFWLQPAYHIQSPGTKLYAVDDSTLRVTFSSGGVTPGDTYVFHLNDKNQIELMEMWVSIIPIEGADADFNNYQTYEPGINVAESRTVLGILTILIDQVKMHSDLKSADERFGPLFEAHPNLK
ncbi:MAG: hypothetical protein CMN77_06955 [Spirochaetaceae bacterium]|nr:hypothetical protein [Spirochaetaceae bacterium]|tara:strand:+ start:21650 stop:22405 length:756 start_codon:yes stop_codon:yes gene_type:complete